TGPLDTRQPATATGHPALPPPTLNCCYLRVRAGQWASIVPHAWLHVFGVPAGMRAVPLVGPVRTERIGLVLPAREPVSVIGQALIDVVERAGIAATLERLPHQAPGDDSSFGAQR
ncbi:hypothetical protein ACWDSL_48055, partial [Streptomyces sp. NPDC000941]